MSGSTGRRRGRCCYAVRFEDRTGSLFLLRDLWNFAAVRVCRGCSKQPCAPIAEGLLAQMPGHTGHTTVVYMAIEASHALGLGF